MNPRTRRELQATFRGALLAFEYGLKVLARGARDATGRLKKFCDTWAGDDDGPRR